MCDRKLKTFIIHCLCCVIRETNGIFMWYKFYLAIASTTNLFYENFSENLREDKTGHKLSFSWNNPKSLVDCLSEIPSCWLSTGRGQFYSSDTFRAVLGRFYFLKLMQITSQEVNFCVSERLLAKVYTVL